MGNDGAPARCRFLRHLFLRHLAGAMVACIAVAVSPEAQSAGQVHLRLQTREALEAHLKSFSTKNSEREALIRKWFAEAGCRDANLTEQALDRKLPPNVICVLPGETEEAIVVGAHTDKVASFGDGVVDNWTGAVLLPKPGDGFGPTFQGETTLEV